MNVAGRMTRYSFTGPDRLLPGDADRARAVVAGLASPSEITTGGADGWDVTVAALALDLWPSALHRIAVPRAPYSADVEFLSDRALALGVRLEVVEAPAHREPYRARNELLVAYGDRLVAAVRRRLDGLAGPYRSGEWMTVNIAERVHLPVDLIVLERPGLSVVIESDVRARVVKGWAFMALTDADIAAVRAFLASGDTSLLPARFQRDDYSIYEGR